MPHPNLPAPERRENMDETIEGLIDTISKHKRSLEWLLQNLDEKNILRVVSRNSDKIFMDRGGIVQSWGDSLAENVDDVKKVRMDFYMPDNIERVDQFLLFFRLLPFRAYSKGALGGGSVSQTSGASSEETTKGFTEVDASYVDTTEDGAHDHSEEVTEQPNHTHKSLMLQGHTHGIEHTHNISLGNHTHDIDYGIYESTSATGIKVYVDGTLRLDNGGSGFTTDQENIDLSEWITAPGWHYVELSSTQLGRLSVAYFTQVFLSV